MAEKKYCGKGKTSKFGVNLEFNLNQFFNHLVTDENKKELGECFNILKKHLKGKNFINVWTNKKDNKEMWDIKMECNPAKETTEFKTHNLTLNEFTPVKQGEKTETKKDEIKDDLPF